MTFHPLVSLYYYAPVAAVVSSVAALICEWRVLDFEDDPITGGKMLVASAVVAFAANLLSVLVVRNNSVVIAFSIFSVHTTVFLVSN